MYRQCANILYISNDMQKQALKMFWFSYQKKALLFILLYVKATNPSSQWYSDTIMQTLI